MKKIIAMLLALVLALSIVGCASQKPEETTEAPTEAATTEAATEATEAPTEAATTEAATEPAVKVMSHEEFVAAPVDSEVTVETYVQAKQGWWENKATIYTQAEDGAYFLYDMPCTEEEYAKLTEGTKIRVTGFKAEWSGEVEIIEASFEILEGNFVAEPVDVTELLAASNEAELLAHQNEKIAAKGLTIKKIEYKNGEPGDDIYLTVALGDAEYSFCVEVYLTGVESDVYKAVGTMKEGDVVDVEGFLYWYEGVNTHVTGIAIAG